MYSDLTADYTDYDYIKGVYTVETDNAHIELWAFDAPARASLWFENNFNMLKASASSSSGSLTRTGGSYSLIVDDTPYRLMFSGAKGIYAYGDGVDDALATINIKDQKFNDRTGSLYGHFYVLKNLYQF